MNRTKIIITILIILLAIAGCYIGYIWFQGYNYNVYQQGLADGQLSLAVQQLNNQIIVISNGTSVQTIKFEEFCKTG